MTKENIKIENLKELNDVIKYYEKKLELSLQDRAILIILKIILSKEI